MEKLKKFLKNENKIHSINNKGLSCIQYIIGKFTYKKFGKGSVVYAPDRILGKKHISISDNVSILHHARMEAIGRYNELQFYPHLEIGINTSIGQNFHAIACGDLTIGRDVTISGNVFISDVAHNYQEIGLHILDQELLYQKTQIGDGCFIGYGAAIQPGVILGKQCVVGTNAVVLSGNYPDYSVLAGVPARVIKRYNVESKKWEKV